MDFVIINVYLKLLDILREKELGLIKSEKEFFDRVKSDSAASILNKFLLYD